MANINKIKVGTVTHDLRPFATCNTGETVTAKVATTEAGNFTLFTGASILVQFNYANSIELPTLNVDGTGAKSIKYGSFNIIPTYYWMAASIVEFVYDGTAWQMIGIKNTDSNTTYSAGAGLSLSSTTFNLDQATTSEIGGIKASNALTSTVTLTSGDGATESRYYGVQVDSAGTAFVNVPWTDNDTKVSFSNTTTNSDYPILFKYSTGITSNAAGARFSRYVTLNPSTRILQVGSASSSSYYGQVNAGNGFYQTSDERLKDFGEDVNIDFDALKSIPKKYFTWKDDEEKKSNIGTSAQALQKIYPELVSDSNGTLIVDYNKLSVIALKAVDELHAENQELKDRLTKLEEMVYGNRN